MSLKRLAAAAAVVLAVSGGLAACGAKQEATTAAAGSAQPLTVMLDWTPNADHSGLYEAMADGAFAKADLDVHVQVPSDPASPLTLLAAGRVDVAISYEPELLLARDQGEPLVSIAALVQRPLTSIVSLGSRHITTPARLRGKTVGDAGIPYQHAYLQTILQHAGVPAKSVREVNVGESLVPAVLSGRVAAVLGAYWNYEAIELRQDGKRVNVIPVDQAGVPTYDELILVARQSEVAHRAGLLRRFVQALGRGYEAVRADPAAGVRALLASDPSLSERLQLASVRATLPAYFPAEASEPWGWQDPAQWTSYGDWMLSHHLIAHYSAVEGAETDALLAGQGS